MLPVPDSVAERAQVWPFTWKSVVPEKAVTATFSHWFAAIAVVLVRKGW